MDAVHAKPFYGDAICKRVGPVRTSKTLDLFVTRPSGAPEPGRAFPGGLIHQRDRLNNSASAPARPAFVPAPECASTPASLAHELPQQNPAKSQLLTKKLTRLTTPRHRDTVLLDGERRFNILAPIGTAKARKRHCYVKGDAHEM
jgi:hypothetical protein